MKSVTIIYVVSIRLSPGRKLPLVMFYVYSNILVYNQRGGGGDHVIQVIAYLRDYD